MLPCLVNFLSNNSVNIVITGCQDEFLSILNSRGAAGWGITLEERGFKDIFDRDQLIYLTGDSEEEMTEFDTEFYFKKGKYI